MFGSDDFENKEKKIFTGLKGLDGLIGGIGPGELVVVAGRPAMGKTSLLMQIAESISLTEQVLFFTLEMNSKHLSARSMRFHEQRIGREKAIDHLNSLKLFLDQSSYPTIDHICHRSADLKNNNGVSMIIIDGFQYIKESLDNSEFVARKLKVLARELDIPIICSSGLSRIVDARVSKRPVLSDLRNCGDLDQYANKVLCIYREEIYYHDIDNKGKAEIICVKNNDNAIGQIEAMFSGALTRFIDFDGQRTLHSVKPVKNSFEA